VVVGDHPDGQRLEDLASGGALARRAAELGHWTDAVGVFRAAGEGQHWAEVLIARSAEHIAGSLASLQMAVDPGCFIVGGGIG